MSEFAIVPAYDVGNNFLHIVNESNENISIGNSFMTFSLLLHV